MGLRGIIEYRLPGSWTLLVGASARDNDYLSTRVAAPEDWWFHVHGASGSHVVLKARPEEEPGRDTLRQAAAVAAYHSKARHAGTVAVHCTRVRNVAKPRGVDPGTVAVSRGRLLKVRPDIGVAERIRD